MSCLHLALKDIQKDSNKVTLKAIIEFLDGY